MVFVVHIVVALACATLCGATVLDKGDNLGRQLRAATSISSPCDAATQRLALLSLYNNTNGAAWVNSTGWPASSAAMTPASMAKFTASTPVTNGSCTASGAVIPDHCCWYGVQCCTPQTCSGASSSQCSACSCTLGLVVGLALGINNVGVCMLVDISSPPSHYQPSPSVEWSRPIPRLRDFPVIWGCVQHLFGPRM